MLRTRFVLCAIALGACGCEPTLNGIPRSVPNSGTPTTSPDSKPTETAPVITPTPSNQTPPAADNTAVNKRDDATDSKTPIDQNEDPGDIKITSDIRKRVVTQPNFSINAQNIKIITAEGKVTLRGPVTTEAERNEIVKIAHDVAGKENVDDQLEIAP